VRNGIGDKIDWCDCEVCRCRKRDIKRLQRKIAVTKSRCSWLSHACAFAAHLVFYASILLGCSWLMGLLEGRN